MPVGLAATRSRVGSRDLLWRQLPRHPAAERRLEAVATRSTVLHEMSIVQALLEQVQTEIEKSGFRGLYRACTW